MKILALEPYYGGSHKSFLESWITHSRHSWTLLSLPSNKWRWRMRHSALTFSNQAQELEANGGAWDLIFCSDMLGLADFIALGSNHIQSLPSISYFHENQVTYPVRHEKERDYHFSFSNMTTALASSQTWFNSRFHQEDFLSGLYKFLKRMPDYQPTDAVTSIREKARVRPPGIEFLDTARTRKNKIPRILWAARWEYDKAPQIFFKALDILQSENVDFKVSVIGGGNARHVAGVFEEARVSFQDHIIHWGYRENHTDYLSVLRSSDIVVSTAEHEFFGISLLEAMAAGAYPLVPHRLSYPEILTDSEEKPIECFFHDGTPGDLASKLKTLIRRIKTDNLWQYSPVRGEEIADRYRWNKLAPQYDEELEKLKRY
ncbi:MAG: tRNA-queuosine alpha-mannosyltransferase domain-containing protein [Verrucomicrobiota bacterium]